MMYYQTDLAFTQNFAELPKGIHVITGLRDSNDKVENAWIIDTLDQKPFLVCASSEDDKIAAVSAMKLAVREYHNQFKRAETTNVETALGLALCNSGYLSMAIDQLENVVRLNPKDADGFYHLGTMRMMLGTEEGLVAASGALGRSIELDNNHIDALANLGLVLLMLDDLTGAHKALSAVLAHTPTHVEAANNLAILLVHRRNSGDLEQAETRVRPPCTPSMLVHFKLFSYHDMLSITAPICHSMRPDECQTVPDLLRCAAGYGQSTRRHRGRSARH